MAEIHVVRSDRRVEVKYNEGWGIAALVVGLALACIASAWWIHASTYHHPTDLRFHAMGAAVAEH